jgi:hypothetical protein
MGLLQSAVTVVLCVNAEYIIRKHDSLVLQNFPTEDLDLIVVDETAKTNQTIKDARIRFQVQFSRKIGDRLCQTNGRARGKGKIHCLA